MEYWGKSDTSVSFCENKYIKSPFIAEYHNTISSLCYVFMGLLLVKKRHRTLGKWLCAVGIGAFLLHATLRKLAQMADEGAMLGLSFNALNQLNPKYSKYWLYPCLLFYVFFCDFFLIFFFMFTSLQVLIVVNVNKKKNVDNKKWIMLYITSFSMAILCWTLDQLCKVKFNTLEPIQLHAWWHFFTSLAIGFGVRSIM
jgi:dihydroceramidase